MKMAGTPVAEPKITSTDCPALHAHERRTRALPSSKQALGSRAHLEGISLEADRGAPYLVERVSFTVRICLFQLPRHAFAITRVAWQSLPEQNLTRPFAPSPVSTGVPLHSKVSSSCGSHAWPASMHCFDAVSTSLPKVKPAAPCGGSPSVKRR